MKASYLFFIKYEETEIFANEMIRLGCDVKKLYISCELKDEHSILHDEMKIPTDIIIVDGLQPAVLAQRCPINNAIFYFLDLKKDDKESLFIRTQTDFFPIEVKNVEKKTRDDWKEAGTVLRDEIEKRLPKSPNSYANSRT